jgi:hypothetical protein
MLQNLQQERPINRVKCFGYVNLQQDRRGAFLMQPTTG